MRKQYHFRPGVSGLDAWDVYRLVAMVESQPIEDVPLQLIDEIDTAYWYQHEGVPTIRSVAEHFRLMMEADLAYPIVLDPQGRVMDGMHRVARALAEGRTTIRARRLSRMPHPDFRDCQPADLPYSPD